MDTKNKSISKLYEFIETAERSRKYPKETASALKVSLRLFETVLNDEEKNSLSVFKNRFEQIYRTVFERNKTKYTTSSLEVYKKRVLKVMSEYESYGEDPSSFNNWTPKVITRKPKAKNRSAAQYANDKTSSEVLVQNNFGSHNMNEIPLRSGVKATLYTPDDLSISDVMIISAFVEFLKITTTQKQKNMEG